MAGTFNHLRVKLDIYLGKEIFYLLDTDYLPCIVDGHLFFSPNGDTSLVKDSINVMYSHPLWNKIPLIIDLLPPVMANITDAVINQLILYLYNNHPNDKKPDIDINEDCFNHSDDKDNFLFLKK